MRSLRRLHEGPRLGAQARHRAGRCDLRGDVALWIEDLDENSPSRQLRLGFDTSGRLLETVVLTFDSGNELIIHAMKARPQMLDLLP